MNLKTIIERVIQLRENQDIQLTLLAACPNSEAVLEAAVQAAGRHNIPMLFAATLNQVDRDGGYTGWTPASFVQKLDEYSAKYGARREWLYPCLDHGGPWLKDAHTRDKLTFEQTFSEVKRSITAVLEAGYTLLHIDPTVDRTINGPLPIQIVAERSLDLMAYAEKERLRLQLPPISYEVGTEEVHGGLVNLESFTEFLRLLYAGLAERNLMQAAPTFIVAQVGTDLHTTTFDAQAAAALYRIVKPYQALIKGHYTDWVENPADYPRTGIGAANVGPEFTSDEYDALVSLTQQEQSHPSHFLEKLTEAVNESNRWQKWLQPDEQGMALNALLPDRRMWIVKTCARYVWTVPQVVMARQQLYANTQMSDPHHYVVDWITASIERYIHAFNLTHALAYFGDDHL
ncbi:MAG: class II D-tagatose-bisphosphate aldolase, non-catalytic subunit [Chloroflexi bacterium]|nr:class II D-tagatose-bisphosphate aldolase, non-catalytic subunit [Chloroflexota bacterium]